MNPRLFGCFRAAGNVVTRPLPYTSQRTLAVMAPTSTSLISTLQNGPPKQAKASPYIPNPVKEALARDELTYAFTIKLLRSIEAVQIAHTAGYNSVLVDLEHAPLTLEQTGQICLAALARGMCPIVRVPQLERHWISRTLDVGALGILVPHVSRAVLFLVPSFEKKSEQGLIAALSLLNLPCCFIKPALLPSINRSRLLRKYVRSFLTHASSQLENVPLSLAFLTLDIKATQLPRRTRHATKQRWSLS